MSDFSVSAQLLGLLSTEPQSLSTIEAAAEKKGLVLSSRRSLQRQLKLLMAKGEVRISGQGKGTRYALLNARAAATNIAAHGDSTSVSLAVAEASAAFYAPASIILSKAGREIKTSVSRSLVQRIPTGYQIALLEAYTPNYSYYLSELQRDQLMQMGHAIHSQATPSTPAPAGTFAKNIFDRLLIDLSWSSSRLEGSTYSRLDTQKLIEQGLAASDKDASQAQMILNHKRAIEYLVHGMAQSGSGVGVNRATVIALHALLSDGLLANPLDGGTLRKQIVGIGGSVYLPLALPQRIEELFDVVIQMASEISDPFEQCFFLMVHLPYLQPFIDVNKRTSRLAANIPLFERNLCPLSFIDVPTQAYTDGLLGVYELQRTELMVDVFMWAYERSCQQYMAVTQQLVPPDILRLRYRPQLSQCILALVTKGLSATADSLKENIPSSVRKDDRDAFIALALRDLQGLHAGNAVRFGISGLQFQAWRESQEN